MKENKKYVVEVIYGHELSTTLLVDGDIREKKSFQLDWNTAIKKLKEETEDLYTISDAIQQMRKMGYRIEEPSVIDVCIEGEQQSYV